MASLRDMIAANYAAADQPPPMMDDGSAPYFDPQARIELRQRQINAKRAMELHNAMLAASAAQAQGSLVGNGPRSPYQHYVANPGAGISAGLQIMANNAAMKNADREEMGNLVSGEGRRRDWYRQMTSDLGLGA